MQFAIGDTDFLLDGSPFRVLSGALHYFRVHPEQWADRIRKARQMGLNTIETYVAWNAHAPTPPEFALNGGLDLGRFLDLVAADPAGQVAPDVGGRDHLELSGADGRRGGVVPRRTGAGPEGHSGNDSRQNEQSAIHGTTNLRAE